VISAAAFDVLISVLKRDRLDLTVTSEVLPGVTRSFDSLSAAADEAALSRIFAGVHFRIDLTRGSRLGRRVADFVVDNVLTRREAEGERDGDDRVTDGDDSRNERTSRKRSNHRAAAPTRNVERGNAISRFEPPTARSRTEPTSSFSSCRQ
jgi:hypothetical protein